MYRTYVNATVIVSGKVVPNTHVSESVAGNTASAELIGMVVLQSMNNARRYGYHMADPNAFVRVEFKQAYTG